MQFFSLNQFLNRFDFSCSSNRVSPSAKKRGVSSSSVNIGTKHHHMFTGGSERLRPLRTRGRAASADGRQNFFYSFPTRNFKFIFHHISVGPAADVKSNSLVTSTGGGFGNSNSTTAGPNSGTTSSLGGGLFSNLSLPRWVRPGPFGRQTSAPAKPPPPPPPTSSANVINVKKKIYDFVFCVIETFIFIQFLEFADGSFGRC